MDKKHIIAAILIGIFFLSCFGYLFIYITNYKKEMDQINVEQILDDLETQKFEANKVEYITQGFNVGMDQINISGIDPADAEYIASGGELPPADNAVVNVYKTTIEQYLSNKRFAEATKKANEALSKYDFSEFEDVLSFLSDASQAFVFSDIENVNEKMNTISYMKNPEVLFYVFWGMSKEQQFDLLLDKYSHIPNGNPQAKIESIEEVQPMEIGCDKFFPSSKDLKAYRIDFNTPSGLMYMGIALSWKDNIKPYYVTLKYFDSGEYTTYSDYFSLIK